MESSTHDDVDAYDDVERVAVLVIVEDVEELRYGGHPIVEVAETRDDAEKALSTYVSDNWDEHYHGAKPDDEKDAINRYFNYNKTPAAYYITEKFVPAADEQQAQQSAAAV